ncbi:DUF5723 family protein [Aurantibacillus circumpalustris]|uniref:DUF5723 family protein n=1 Tax=Aurantibacillus circumpalustris TaxID=3036359 RepID=UPI00295BA974|nr:DUF5723 family protein [Aurantibacillus circumpalustris]
MRTLLHFFLLFLASFTLYAQERLGITNSNYYSTANIQLNPSSSVDSRTYMQLHLAGVNIYAKTNFAYLPNFNIKQIANPPEPIRTEGTNKKFLYVNGSAEALSFVMSKRTYGFGFFVRARTVLDMRGVSYELASALLNGQGFSSVVDRSLLGQKLKNAKFSHMSWAEYGINLGKIIKREQDILITVGTNLKYLTGINIIYANILEFDSYNDGNGAFGVNNLDAKILRNKSKWNSGKGFGLDLGITYKIMEGYVDKYYANSKLSNCDYVDYKCKIALSLRDLGFINFKGANTDTRVKGSGFFDPYHSDTSFVDALGYNFQNTTVQGNPILASLPTALTGQFDYNFDNSIYLNFTLVKNLVPTRITGVPSPDLFSICPRIEFKQFEFALPLTFQKFIYPQLGFGLRFRSFVVGMDNMFPLFLTRNTNGFNVYCSLAISLFRNPACNTKRMSVSKCPSYRKTGKNKAKKRKHF